MMNSVHFPKLDEYAIQPVLIKEPSSYGYFGTSSSGNNASSLGGDKPGRLDQLGRSRGSAYFQRTSNLKELNDTGYDKVHQEKPSTTKENVDLEPSTHPDRHKTARRQTAIENEGHHSTGDNVPTLPSLAPGREFLVSDSSPRKGKLLHGVPQQHGARGPEDKSVKRALHIGSHAPPTLNRQEEQNLSGLRDLRELHDHTEAGSLDGEEAPPSTTDQLRKAYKFRKGDPNRVQSKFVDGFLWDYEVPVASVERSVRRSSHLPGIHPSTNLTSHDVYRDRLDDQADDAGAKRRLRSKLQNGYNFLAPRQSLWRVPVRKVLQHKDHLQRFQKLSIGILNVLKLAKAIIKP
ncbi:hypothetical protein EGW08_019682 [Elysia chlorotica]|uniref:Uncharacterized protein n=1 Tax=Elysia chlorotica TaxID=188477 RepID=A0A433STH3_ELYCH|nr:hypothetical protein EGW08_019682 [Elysia chlorotica]